MGSSGEDVEGRPRLGLGLYWFTRVSYRVPPTVTLYRLLRGSFASEAPFERRVA